MLPIGTIFGVLGRVQENLRLPTKLLLSFLLLTASLTCTVLLVVRHNSEAQAQLQIERSARSAISTFQFVQRQQAKVLSHKAELLASLALMRDGDATTIEDVGNDPWQSEDCNLFLLADKRGRILAMHFSGPAISLAEAQGMLTRSIYRRENSDWWSEKGWTTPGPAISEKRPQVTSSSATEMKSRPAHCRRFRTRT